MYTIDVYSKISKRLRVFNYVSRFLIYIESEVIAFDVLRKF